MQKLAGQGLGAVAVAVDPAQFKGVTALPVSALKSGAPALLQFNHTKHGVTLTFEQFTYGWSNALPVEEGKALYEKYHVPASGVPIFQAATANFNPFAETAVDSENHERGPLLLIVGELDHTVPVAVVGNEYKIPSDTELAIIPGRGHSLTSIPDGAKSPTRRWSSCSGTCRRAAADSGGPGRSRNRGRAGPSALVAARRTAWTVCMTFFESIKTVFRKYAEFGGRASRPEFWWFALFSALVSAALNALSVPISGATYGSGMMSGRMFEWGANGNSVYGYISFASVWSIVVLLPSLAVTVRRLRDAGRTWTELFWLLLPIAGAIVLIVHLCDASKPGDVGVVSSPASSPPQASV